MSRAIVERARRAGPSTSAEKDELTSLIDWGLLGRLGFDPKRECFAPDADDPVFGFAECKAAICDQVARTSLGLCWRCDQLWQEEQPPVCQGDVRHLR
jgi:hypothetical protein